VLRGHDFDLQDWREMLKPPFDPWVEVHGSDAVLRSESLDGLTSASEVRDRVVAHIDRLNGAMFVMRQSQPLQFSGVVELAPDGKVHRTVFVEGGAHVRARVGAIAVVIGPDGKPKSEPPPKPSEAQTWAAIADGDDLLEDALTYFGRVSVPDPVRHPPTFWFDIYKALECLIGRFGGETAFIALDWAARGASTLRVQSAQCSARDQQRQDLPWRRPCIGRCHRTAFPGHSRDVRFTPDERTLSDRADWSVSCHYRK
jgi:hypothetical protein